MYALIRIWYLLCRLLSITPRGSPLTLNSKRQEEDDVTDELYETNEDSKLYAELKEKKLKCGYCAEFFVNVDCPKHGESS